MIPDHEREARRRLPVGLPRLPRSSLRVVPVLLVAAIIGLQPVTAGAAPPTAIAESASEVAYSTARALGVIDPGGLEAFYRFEYIADPLYDHNVAGGGDPFAGASGDGFGRLAAGFGPVAVAPLLGEAGGLEAGVEYHLRLVAESAEGTVIAVGPNFVTPKPLEPIACTGDNCQALPPEPRDPGLSTTVAGVGNPRVHYVKYGSEHKKGRKHHKGKKHAGNHKAAKAKKGGRHSSKGRS